MEFGLEEGIERCVVIACRNIYSTKEGRISLKYFVANFETYAWPVCGYAVVS